MSKRILYLLSSENVLSNNQLLTLKHFSNLIFSEVCFEIFNDEGLRNIKSNKYTYKYICLMGHSNIDVFGESDINYKWSSVIKTLLECDIFFKDSTLILKSCFSGEANIPDNFLQDIPKLNTIISFGDAIQNMDGFICVIIYIYSMEWKLKSVEKSALLSSNLTDVLIKITLRKAVRSLEK